MWNMIWPILIVVGANTIYNISTKSTPAEINPFASLSITYFVAMISAVCLYFVTSPEKKLLSEMGKSNWAAVALGLAIVFLEFGFVCIYRSGWKISMAQLVTSILVTCVLLMVGLLFYKESLALRQIIGMIVCAVGLVLLAK